MGLVFTAVLLYRITQGKTGKIRKSSGFHWIAFLRSRLQALLIAFGRFRRIHRRGRIRVREKHPSP